MSNTKLNEVLSKVWQIKSSGQFKLYIDFIRFPFYRNLDLDATVHFDFPLTVFIGQNGCGKSSCLHALYGAPKSNTPSSFWFDTKVDPINYYNDEKKRHSFWYSFLAEDKSVKEIIKARIQRDGDPNYWETSRPLEWAGMKTRTDKKRDTPINKKVVYIDFRAELSAFDKYFYFGNTKGLRSSNKQEFIRRKSASLQKILAGKVLHVSTNKGVVNKPVRNLNHEELSWISYILGRQYISGQFVEHELFRNDGYSLLFNTEHAKYSEAYAGSGEVAVARLVMKVLEATSYSLILLDEPEVSLHPGAQDRLKMFLLDQIKLKKHQVVLTSHSPSIIKGLPREAIKVFYRNPNNGRFLIKEGLSPEEAFYHLEFSHDSRKNIVVEDVLAKEIVSGVLSIMGSETENIFNVKYNPGGHSVIKKDFATVYCREHNTKDFILFDGDQKPVDTHFDWRVLSSTDINSASLSEIIKKQTGNIIVFSVDGGTGGGNDAQRLDLQKRYLDYFLHNIFYLPKLLPEDIIWDEKYMNNIVHASGSNSVLAQIESINKSNDVKSRFAKVAEIVYGNDDASNIASTHRQFLRHWLNQANEDFKQIRSIIQSIAIK